MFLMCKISESKRQQNELNKQKITERELNNLNVKISKLLVKLEENEQETAKSPDEECVICITNRATIFTEPCNHQVICRRCFVKTIQNSVAQKNLPLRCVICREKILRLKQSFTATNPSDNRLKYSKKQTRANLSLQPTYQYTNNKIKKSKKRLNELSTSSMPFKMSSKTKLAQTAISQPNNDENAMENKKTHSNENLNNSTAGENSRTGELNDLNNNLEESIDERSSPNANETNCANGLKLEEVELEEGTNRTKLERIEKLKILSKSNQTKSVRSRLLNLFNVQIARVQDVKYKKTINYSIKTRKTRSNWFANLKDELKVLFKF